MYGFEIKAKQQVVAEMKKVEKAMTDMQKTVEGQTKRAEKSIEQMGDTARKVGEQIAAAFAVRELYEFGKELLHITAEFEAFQNVIKYSSKDAYDAAQNLDYVRNVITRLHLPMREAYQGFSEMQAGLIGTGIEGERVRRLFEGISTAATVLHLPAHNLEMVLYDFKEIGERGLNMRNMRSLMGWLPGVSEIVKETFHKTFQELQKEGMGGPEFLDKLSVGLQKHFAPGLGNAGNSLQSALNDTTNSFMKMKLEMGENLRPLFIEIMTDIRNAFNSTPVKLFVENIKPIATTLLELVKIWAMYKTGVVAAQGIMAGYRWITQAATSAQVMFGTAVATSEVEVSALKTTLITSGVGAFAVALGLVVQQFIKMNEETDKATDKLSHLKEITDGFNRIADTYHRTNTAFSGLAGMNGGEKSELLRDLMGENKDITDEMNTHARTLLSQAHENFKNFTEPKRTQGESDIAYSGRLEQFYNQRNVLQQKVSEASNRVADLQGKGLIVLNQIATLQKQGVKPAGLSTLPGSGMAEGALNTVGLAGAKGGLGEAKIINIRVDTMQRVSVGTPTALKNAGQDAIEVMLRALNNIAYGQSRTQ